MPATWFGENQTTLETPQVHERRDDGLRLVLFPQDQAPCNHGVHHELLPTHEYSIGPCEVICPTAKGWSELGHAAGKDCKASVNLYQNV